MNNENDIEKSLLVYCDFDTATSDDNDNNQTHISVTQNNKIPYLFGIIILLLTLILIFVEIYYKKR